jgi:GNAT superfamily N-acetyltransferase
VSELEVYLAEVEHERVGSVSIDGEFLRTLYVVPSHWGRGVGSSLHDHALARSRARGCACAKLWTLEQNIAARRFYEKRGWTLNGETRIVPFPPNPLDVGYSRTL